MDFKSIAIANMILKIRVGSHLFGTDTEDSDLDLFGVFMPDPRMVYGFQVCNEVDLGEVDKDDTGRNTKDAIDFKLHEYRKFVKLAMQNNPNILHVLFVNPANILFIEPFGRRLLDKADIFVHKGAHHRFVKYADSQRHKMRIKPLNYQELEIGLKILEGLDDHLVMADVMIELGKYEPGLGQGAFRDVGRGKHVKCGDLSFERGVFVKKARRMIRERLSRATSRHVLFTKHGFDTKFASNLIQLLKEGIELMETGRIQFPLAYADEILHIKHGKYTAQEINEWADILVEDARVAYERSSLPKEPRSAEIEGFVVEEVSFFTEVCCQ